MIQSLATHSAKHYWILVKLLYSFEIGVLSEKFDTYAKIVLENGQERPIQPRWLSAFFTVLHAALLIFPLKIAGLLLGTNLAP
jgi:hypothetical protein